MTEKKADKILFNGRLITMENGTIAQAVAIKGNRILYVGSDDEALKDVRIYMTIANGETVY